MIIKINVPTCFEYNRDDIINCMQGIGSSKYVRDMLNLLNNAIAELESLTSALMERFSFDVLPELLLKYEGTELYVALVFTYRGEKFYVRRYISSRDMGWSFTTSFNDTYNCDNKSISELYSHICSYTDYVNVVYTLRNLKFKADVKKEIKTVKVRPKPVRLSRVGLI